MVLRDVPAVKDEVNTPDCLALHPDDVMACADPRSRGLVRDVRVVAAQRGAPPGVHIVDLSDQFCAPRRRHPVVGDVIVYRHNSHLSKEYSTLLAPYVLRAVRPRGP